MFVVCILVCLFCFLWFGNKYLLLFCIVLSLFNNVSVWGVNGIMCLWFCFICFVGII